VQRPPARLEREIGRDRVDPAAERPRPPKPVDVYECPYEGLLADVLRVGLGLEQAATESLQARRVRVTVFLVPREPAETQIMTAGTSGLARV
jgi:hypothetical protein